MKAFSCATAAAAALLSASLASCSLIGSEDDRGVTAPTGTASQSAEPTDASTDGADDDYQTVTAPSTQISFDVPAKWKVISNDGQGTAIIAETLGVGTDGEAHALTAVDLEAIAPKRRKKGYAENVSVAPAAEFSSLPSEETLSALIRTWGATPGEYSVSETALGDAAVMTSSITEYATAVQGASIIVSSKDGDWTTITVLTSDASRTKELTDTIISTLS